MPPADNTPDFDKMTPEEIMAWMESLAKRQNATEGFTTAADVEIPEIDPDSVVIDEPGYVPSEGKMKGKKIETIIPPKSAPRPATPAPTPTPAVQQPAAVAPLPPVQQPVAQPPAAAAPPPAPAPQPAAKQPEPEPTSALSWLESLAADQGGDFPSFDLSSIAADLAPTTSSAEPAQPATSNPVDWLESLSQGQGVENVLPVEPDDVEPAVANPPDWLADLQGQSTPAPETPAPQAAANPVDWLESLSQGQGVQEIPPVETPAPAEAGDPVSWLESLARHQGAPSEELTTPANLNIELPDNPVADGPGYTGYTFETPDTFLKQTELNIPASQPAAPQPASEAEMQDPSAWLDALATSKGTPEPRPSGERHLSDDEIQKALAKGEVVPHDQMEAWMNRQLEIGAQREEPPELEAFDPDAPAVKAEIPDWLLEQVGSAPPEEVTQPLPPSAPPLVDTIFEPPAVSNIPDWLKEEEPASASEFEDIFAPTPDAPAAVPVAPASSGAIQIDPNDPWVEALEMEYAQGKGTPPAQPPSQPPAAAPAAALKEAALQPETELPAGQPEPVPDWLQGLTSQTEEEPAAVLAEMPDWLNAPVEPSAPSSEQPAIVGEMPDWLSTVDIEAEEVPAWLTETLGTSSEEVSEVVLPPLTTPATSAPVPVAAPARSVSPAPVPARALQIDVPATLNNARSSASSNDIEGSLRHYEQLIRANAELDAVIGDLVKLSEKVKTHPAVYRVLGDGLMRQGKLQNALDIYRKGLNQL